MLCVERLVVDVCAFFPGFMRFGNHRYIIKPIIIVLNLVILAQALMTLLLAFLMLRLRLYFLRSLALGMLHLRHLDRSSIFDPFLGFPAVGLHLPQLVYKSTLLFHCV